MSRLSRSTHRSAPAERHAPVVLVLEDEPALQELMARLLRVHGYESRHGRTVQEAIAAAERDRVDTFILDIGLRGAESGLGVLKWLRAQPQYAETPVVIVTGRRVLSADQQELLRTHHAHVIHKPHSHMTLVNHLKKVTQHS